MPTIVASENPELANQLVEQILAGESFAAPQPEPEARVASVLPDTHVELPGGYYNADGDLLTTAEVRELNGFDEEELSKARGALKTMDVLLSRGVVRVGEMAPNRKVFDRMLTCDRDALLLAIRIATYGHEVELTEFPCRSCGAFVDLTVDLRDVEVKRLDDPDDRQFTVKLQRGEAVVHLPDGYTQREALAEEDKGGQLTEAELKTIVLKNCVDTVNGLPVVNEDSVRGLSVRDRLDITKALNEHAVGPQLDSVTKACPSCEEDIKLPKLDLLALFRQ